MMHETATAIPVTLACALLGLAVWSDMRNHRIPNWLVLALLVVGFAYQVMTNGPLGLAYGLGGLVVGLASFIGFYLGRGMGAGDVKLMGAAGVMFGPIGALLASAISLVAGLVLVLGARQILHLTHRYAALRAIPDIFVQKNDALRVPYAPAIAVGCGVAYWQQGLFSTLILITG